MIGRLLQGFQIVRRPGEQVVAQVLVRKFGAFLGQIGEQRQHEADMVLGRALVGGACHANASHPGAQGERGLTEDDALAVGVHRAPGRRRQMTRAHEQAAVLPDQLLVVGAGSQTAHHSGERRAGLSLFHEGPLGSGGLRIQLGQSGEGVGGIPRARVVQKERGQARPNEGHRGHRPVASRSLVGNGPERPRFRCDPIGWHCLLGHSRPLYFLRLSPDGTRRHPLADAPRKASPHSHDFANAQNTALGADALRVGLVAGRRRAAPGSGR